MKAGRGPEATSPRTAPFSSTLVLKAQTPFTPPVRPLVPDQPLVSEEEAEKTHATIVQHVPPHPILREKLSQELRVRGDGLGDVPGTGDLLLCLPDARGYRELLELACATVLRLPHWHCCTRVCPETASQVMRWHMEPVDVHVKGK